MTYILITTDLIQLALHHRHHREATKHLSQDFQENKSGLTVHPPHVGLASVKAAVSNPSKRDMDALRTGDGLGGIEVGGGGVPADEVYRLRMVSNG